MKTIKYLLIPVFLFSLLTTCSIEDNRDPSGFPLKVSDNLDDLDYQLYSLILEELFENSTTLVVDQYTQYVSFTAGNDYIKYLKEGYPELDPTVFSDYVIKNDTVYYLENKFNIASKNVILVSEEEIQFIFNSGDVNKGWTEFYKRFPGSNGEISFSRIGYNTGKTLAMVEMGNMYASLGGEGSLIFLKFENNGWKILRAIPTWIS